MRFQTLKCKTVLNGDKRKFFLKFFSYTHTHTRISRKRVKRAMTVFPSKTSQDELVLLKQI